MTTSGSVDELVDEFAPGRLITGTLMVALFGNVISV